MRMSRSEPLLSGGYSPVGGEAQVVVLPVEQAAGQRVVLAHHLVRPRRGLGEADLGGRAVELDLGRPGRRGRRSSAPAAIASATSFCMATSASPAWVAQHQSASAGAASATAASSRWACAQHS